MKVAVALCYSNGYNGSRRVVKTFVFCCGKALEEFLENNPYADVEVHYDAVVGMKGASE